MKILAKFTGVVLKYNPDGLSRVRLTEVGNGNSCETDSTTSELQKVGVDSDGCEFEVIITDENGAARGKIQRITPEAPPQEIEPSPETNQVSDFNI